MKKKIIYMFFILTIFLFCTEIGTASFNNPYLPNLLLVFLTYLIYQHQPIYQYIVILLGIELISLLQTGASGFSSIILIPLISKFLRAKTFLYLKLLTPCLFIFAYEFLYELLIFLLCSSSYNFTHACIRTIINCSTFLLIYWMWPTLDIQEQAE